VREKRRCTTAHRLNGGTSTAGLLRAAAQLHASRTTACPGPQPARGNVMGTAPWNDGVPTYAAVCHHATGVLHAARTRRTSYQMKLSGTTGSGKARDRQDEEGGSLQAYAVGSAVYWVGLVGDVRARR
jgi:hypothetical protein